MAQNFEGKVADVVIYSYSQGSRSKSSAKVPKEKEIKIKVNDLELVNILCSPEKLDYLIYGFLYNGKIIEDVSDIKSLEWDEKRSEVNVRIYKEFSVEMTDRYLPVGLGGGFFRKKGIPRIESEMKLSAGLILKLAGEFEIYLENRGARGIHTSALASETGLEIITDDIGRHNTIDKIMGEALIKGIRTKDKVLMTTGRISSEMVYKCGTVGVPILITRRSPTDNSISLASEMGVTIVGLATRENFGIFSCPERIYE